MKIFAHARQALETLVAAMVKIGTRPVVTIQKVEIVISGSTDPSRVATIVQREIVKMGRKTSGHVPAYDSTPPAH